MDVKQYELFTKVHNELIKRMGIKADKYERQDSFGAIIDIQNGKDMKETIIKTFKMVYDVEIPNAIYNSCYENCKGFMDKGLIVYHVGFNGNDETEVDAASECEAVELAKTIANESGLDFKLDYIEPCGYVKEEISD